MNVMTKQGSLDNVITYEHYCDTKADLANIPKSQITLGSVAVVLQDENDSMGIYIAGSDKQWNEISTSINGGNSSTSVDLISICTSEEYDAATGLPTVEFPEENKLYLVPNNGDNNNLFNEWIWTGEEWEQFGGSSAGSITITQSDWNQNDTTAPDYIKNRICYDDVSTTPLIDTDYSLSYPYTSNSKYYYSISFDSPVLFNENITESNDVGLIFIIDNQEYILNYCKKIIPNEDDQSYFYYIITDTSDIPTITVNVNADASGYLGGFTYTSDTSIEGTHHITILKSYKNYVTIPTKYLPGWPYATINTTQEGSSITIGSTTITEQQLQTLLSLSSATGVSF